MTGAAVALALAVLIAPASSRQRARLLMMLPRRRRRPTVGPLAVALGAALSILLPWTAIFGLGLLAATLMARRRLGIRRQAEIEEAFALQGALDVLVAELRVGAHPVAAIGVAARESRGRIAQSLSSVAARAVLGADVAAGLRAEAQRSTSPCHWERLAVCWDLAQTHGLAIATLMQVAQRDIVERARFRGRVDAGMAGARATAAILAGLPLLGVLLGQSIGADPLSFLFTGGAGGWLLVIGSGLTCCGLLWSDRITTKVLI
ncbi:membrane protein [Mycolicibacterium cyprinidarum]|uniref:Membrane protein n=1 Tax=Mycolicibacterium cyprinidarum TaxID=2860311 RepID=A0ABQ4V994_9MYCO|nr:membrane protein [Mycolicibacterium sp. NGTWSNA01]GJF19829.1 membrane protein [Mycolicibacterium sp. NGTWS0302]